MFTNDEYVMLSALQHFAFCPRQCALIHIEQAWAENIYTLRGLRVHETVNKPGDELIKVQFFIINRADDEKYCSMISCDR